MKGPFLLGCSFCAVTAAFGQQGRRHWWYRDFQLYRGSFREATTLTCAGFLTCEISPPSQLDAVDRRVVRQKRSPSPRPKLLSRVPGSLLYDADAVELGARGSLALLVRTPAAPGSSATASLLLDFPAFPLANAPQPEGAM